MKQFNEKPSKYKNLGVDVSGAQRHNYDTYENPEQKALKERKKREKNALKELKEKAKDSLTEDNCFSVIENYEFQRVLISLDLPVCDYSKESMATLREIVVNTKDRDLYHTRAKAYNRLSRKLRRNRWHLKTQDAMKYFEPKKKKNSFTELNGRKTDWILETTFDTSSLEHLKQVTRAVQFGNSLPDKEREYCLHNLSQTLKDLEQLFSFDFNKLAFSFGARGKAGSIAHYEDSQKVVAINRSWDGALIHEIGHAIDYDLDLVSKQLPTEIRDKYRDKIRAVEFLSWEEQRYYLKPVELFARLFEQYVRMRLPHLSEYAQHTRDARIMPELDKQAIKYLDEVLSPILKGA